MSISPAEYSNKEMHKNIEIVDKGFAYSRKSSGISDDDLFTVTDHKFSRRQFSTVKIRKS